MLAVLVIVLARRRAQELQLIVAILGVAFVGLALLASVALTGPRRRCNR